MRELINIITTLSEMAVPSDAMRETTFYHGTKSKEAAVSIWKNGLDSNFTNIKYGDKNPVMRPVVGRVYVTPHLDYACIYALNGVLMGTDLVKQSGWVLEFDGKQLGDVQPDEDSVGEFINYYLNKHYYSEKYPEVCNSPLVARITNMASSLFKESTMRKVKDGYSLWITKVGKSILKHLTDSEKLQLIKLGAHVANHGIMIPNKLWEITPKAAKMLERDCSNFHSVAKLRKSRNTD